jgi:hypothetical protein
MKSAGGKPLNHDLVSVKKTNNLSIIDAQKVHRIDRRIRDH